VSAAGTRPPSGAAIGLTVFAAVMMVMLGTFHVLQGVVALFNQDFYVIGVEYVFLFDLGVWGWVHLVLGALVLWAGFALFTGAVWARTVGVVVALVSAIASFMWLPYQPVWAVLVIVLDVFVIWALTAHGRDVTTG